MASEAMNWLTPDVCSNAEVISAPGTSCPDHLGSFDPYSRQRQIPDHFQSGLLRSPPAPSDLLGPSSVP